MKLILSVLLCFGAQTYAESNPDACLARYESSTRFHHGVVLVETAAGIATFFVTLTSGWTKALWPYVSIVAATAFVPSPNVVLAQSSDLIAGAIRESRLENVQGPKILGLTHALNAAVFGRNFESLGYMFIGAGISVESVVKRDLAEALQYKAFRPEEVHQTLHLLDEQNQLCSSQGKILSSEEFIELMVNSVKRTAP